MYQKTKIITLKHSFNIQPTNHHNTHVQIPNIINNEDYFFKKIYLTSKRYYLLILN